MTMSIAPQKGFTLIELMIACVILSILVFISVPLLQVGGRTIAWQVAEHLRLDIELARLQASAHSQAVGICPTEGSLVCETHWHRDYLLINLKEATLISVRQLPKEITLQYRGFPHSDSVDFSPFGHLMSNGTFSILYRGKVYYRVVLNRAGRVKITPS